MISKHTMKSVTAAMALLALLITLPVSAGSSDRDKHQKDMFNPNQQWYIRLTVIAPDEDSLRDRGNVLGQLDDSVLGYDSHDLPELNPFATPYLTLVFVHDDWPEPGNYSSDFHATPAYDPDDDSDENSDDGSDDGSDDNSDDDSDDGSDNSSDEGSDDDPVAPVVAASDGDADQWLFEVHSDDAFRNITLYWDPVKLVVRSVDPDSDSDDDDSSDDFRMDTAEDLLYRMWLEDTQTGDRVYAADGGYLQSYRFNMNGNSVRTFRWVLEDRFGRPVIPAAPMQMRATKMMQPASLRSGSDGTIGLPPAVER